MHQIELTTNGEALSTLVERVRDGAEILLTHDGQPVARLIQAASGEPPRSEEKKQQIRDAIASIRARAKRLDLGPFDIEEFKRDRDEGRR